MFQVFTFQLSEFLFELQHGIKHCAIHINVFLVSSFNRSCVFVQNAWSDFFYFSKPFFICFCRNNSMRKIPITSFLDLINLYTRTRLSGLCRRIFDRYPIALLSSWNSGS